MNYFDHRGYPPLPPWWEDTTDDPEPETYSTWQSTIVRTVTIAAFVTLVIVVVILAL
ncbi:hypothetical protein [Nocardia colli]|uniref:hypothetical protein n=1 Tax=Nocardia colli TaxID=2545717 RepID=UPI0035E274BA